MRRGVLVLSSVAACGRIDFGPVPGATGLPVRAGSFLRGYDVAADGKYTDTTHPATVGAFRLDEFEVTVARFRRFVDAGSGTALEPPQLGDGARVLGGVEQGGWDPAWTSNLAPDTATLVKALDCYPPFQTWTPAAGMNESMPIDCVTWFEAFAFCTWNGGFLPTELEWNYAASGGDQQRAYPWSSPPDALAVDCDDANYYMGPMYCTNGLSSGVAPVGSRSPTGDARWGHADLVGNMAEWMLDGYAPFPATCDDCADTVDANPRMVLGGDFRAYAADLRSADRTNANPPTDRNYGIGFRCAYPP